jgi:hypothetical protein
MPGTLVIKLEGTYRSADVADATMKAVGRVLMRNQLPVPPTAVDDGGYVFVSVADQQITESLIGALRLIPGVEAAYLKPPEALP